MKIEDFYELKAGQDIYYRGKEAKVKKLYLSWLNGEQIALSGMAMMFFKNVMHDLSFDPPEKPKRKETFWLWFDKECNSATYLVCNNKGIHTDGTPWSAWSNPDYKWHKIEGSEFTVEVGW